MVKKFFSWNRFIWFHEFFFCLDFLKISGLLCADQANIFWALSKYFQFLKIILEYLVTSNPTFAFEYYQLACRTHISKWEGGRVVIMASISPNRYLMKRVHSMLSWCSSVLWKWGIYRYYIEEGKMTERVEQMCWRQSDSHSSSWMGLWAA